MKGYTSCQIPVLPFSEMRGGENSHPSFTAWDEKRGNMNTQDNSFEVWIKKRNEALGAGAEDGKLPLYHIESFILSTSVCLLRVSNHKLDNKSAIKLAIPRKHVLQTMSNSKVWRFFSSNC